MFIKPTIAIEKGWINFPDTMSASQIDKCIQPNAIDFDINQLFIPTSAQPFVLDADFKQHQKFTEQLPTDSIGRGLMFKLDPGCYYDFSSSVYVELPIGVCGMLIVRSTLNRNGVFLTAGLYDSGFQGTVAGTLHNRSINPAFISPNSMIGQIMLFHAEDGGKLYSGGYNTAPGQHWIK